MKLINHFKEQLSLLNYGNVHEKMKALTELKNAKKATRDFSINCSNNIKEGDYILFFTPNFKDISYLSKDIHYSLINGRVIRVSQTSCTIIKDDNQKVVIKINDLTSIAVFRKKWRDEERRNLVQNTSSAA
jgi:hypothetical protein